VQEQIRLLAGITETLAQASGNTNNVYYSLENNTLGEAALVALSEYGEDKVSGIFLSEPAKAASGRRYRKGFNTTNKSKLAACSKFKNLVETGKLKIASKNLISELKVFVASGGSYAAKIGETDDLVMSMLLAVRIATFLREFDPALDQQLKDSTETEVMPLPFIMS
jgi:hypothetical protein